MVFGCWVDVDSADQVGRKRKSEVKQEDDDNEGDEDGGEEILPAKTTRRTRAKIEES